MMMLFIAFIVYITIKGELGTYLGFFALPSTANAATPSSIDAGGNPISGITNSVMPAINAANSVKGLLGIGANDLSSVFDYSNGDYGGGGDLIP